MREDIFRCVRLLTQIVIRHTGAFLVLFYKYVDIIQFLCFFKILIIQNLNF